jgi:hypothetical protein
MMSIFFAVNACSVKLAANDGRKNFCGALILCTTILGNYAKI